jgi:hypothetical protein
MADPAQEIVESIAVLMLQAQGDLSGVTVVKSAADTKPGPDRIVCKARTREVELSGLNLGTPKVARIPLEVIVKLSERNANKFEAWIAAVEAAFSPGASVPAGAATLAATLSSTLVRFEDTDEGSEDNSENVRTWMKVYNCLFQP